MPRRALPLATVLARQIGTTTGDLAVVTGWDAPIPFTCAQTGRCCEGRNVGVSNLVLPSEAAGMWAWAQANRGLTAVREFVPAWLARGGSPLTGRGVDAGFRFEGMFFVMRPDPQMQDGDRCVFLAGTSGSQQHACSLHGTAAQPLACAVAPLAVSPVETLASPPTFAYPKSRAGWCRGMRETLAGQHLMTTPREIFARTPQAFERVEELRAFQSAATATRTWRRGYQNHLSPLSRLYVAACPDLDSVLVGF